MKIGTLFFSHALKNLVQNRVGRHCSFVIIGDWVQNFRSLHPRFSSLSVNEDPPYDQPTIGTRWQESRGILLQLGDDMQECLQVDIKQ